MNQGVVLTWMLVMTAVVSFLLCMVLMDRGSIERAEVDKGGVTVVYKTKVIDSGFGPPLPDKNPRH